MKDLAVISKMALSRNVDGAGIECLNIIQDNLELFNHYLRGIALDGMKAMRVIAVDLPDNRIIGFKWKVKQFQKVECGDVIATYLDPCEGAVEVAEEAVEVPVVEVNPFNEKVEPAYEIEEIKAPVSGTIFQFRDNNTNYGVISHEKDSKDSIKSWLKTKLKSNTKNK